MSLLPGEELAKTGNTSVETPPNAEKTGREQPSVGAYFVALLLGLLPVAGIAFDILWGYGYSRKPWRTSLAKAMLLWHAIVMAVIILLLAGRILALLSTHPMV